MRQNKQKNLEKSLFAVVMAASAMSFGSAYSLADQHCSCDEKCTEQCSKGEHKDCGCETCSCAKGKKCNHGKCARHSDKAGKAEEAEKSEHR